MLMRRCTSLLAAAVLMAAVALLPACATTEPIVSPGVEQTTTVAVQSACASATAALKVLTVANVEGKVTPAQKAAISKAGHALLPVCGASAQPTVSSTAMGVFRGAVEYLTLQAGAVR